MEVILDNGMIEEIVNSEDSTDDKGFVNYRLVSVEVISETEKDEDDNKLITAKVCIRKEDNGVVYSANVSFIFSDEFGYEVDDEVHPVEVTFYKDTDF